MFRFIARIGIEPGLGLSAKIRVRARVGLWLGLVFELGMAFG